MLQILSNGYRVGGFLRKSLHQSFQAARAEPRLCFRTIGGTLTFAPHTSLKPFHTMAQRYHPYRPARVAPNRPCYFFKKGQCSKDSCMFAHEFIPCVQNPCNDIARCPFVHPGEPGYAVQQAPQAQPRTFRPAAPAYVRPCFFFKKVHIFCRRGAVWVLY